MEKLRLNKQWVWLGIVVQLLLLTEYTLETPIRNLGSLNSAFSPVKLLNIDHNHVVLDNGLVKVTFSTPGGMVTQIQYQGIDILEYNKDTNRGYWDIIWSRPEDHLFDGLEGTSFSVIREDENQIEISFRSTWDPSQGNKGRTLNVDKRFIMLRGSSGFYTYSIFERLKGWPGISIGEARIAFKLQNKRFKYMAISDTRQRFMPSPYDRSAGQTLDYKEAVLLTNPYNSTFKGEVDDKYQYSKDVKDNRVHGWICFDPAVGFWVITGSNEFRVGGPLKQELTSHVGPTSIATFFSNHYAGSLKLEFQDGEPWKKVLGPVFIYLNKASTQEDPLSLWKDAKQQMVKETRSWPYNFPMSEDFLKANQRGTIIGRLLVRDRYINRELINASSAYVGLATPGEVRSWQTETKGYQFWTQADSEGNFVIKNVRPGIYNLYAWVPGIIGDYKNDVALSVTPGSKIRIGDVVYDPPRMGPTLWEIGIPDRTASEFYIPNPDPSLTNPLYLNHPEKFRQYGLWDRYSELYPDTDLVYIVGRSSYQKDWFFAHVTRKINGTFVPTTWRIVFDLKYVIRGSYTLHLALASSNLAELQVRINDPHRIRPHFTTRLVGRDNAIARHGIHGLYWLYSVNIPSYQLLKGSNTIYLRQSRANNQFQGLMYDYIRFEGPPQTI